MLSMVVSASLTAPGYSYCRHCILEWYRAHDRQNKALASPTTNEPLADRSRNSCKSGSIRADCNPGRLLLPNLTLRDAIHGIQCHAVPAWNDAPCKQHKSVRNRTARRAPVKFVLILVWSWLKDRETQQLAHRLKQQSYRQKKSTNPYTLLYSTGVWL